MNLIINSDGGARGNPGPAAIGIVIFDDKRNIIKKYKEKIGNATNNVAEYSALIKCLELAKEFSLNEISIYLDSELVTRQMNGIYSVKQEHLKKLFLIAKDLEKSYKKVIYKNVPREDYYQKMADKLVNEALDEK